MAYPHPDEIAQIIGSEPTVLMGTLVDRAVSGRPRFQTLHSQDWIEFKIIHEVYIEDYETIKNFYEANKLSAFTFTWAGNLQEYEVRFGAPIAEIPIEGSLRHRLVVTLVTV